MGLSANGAIFNRKNDDDITESPVDLGVPYLQTNPYGGFPKWGYPQSSSILMVFPTINHPAIGVLPL